MSASGVGADLKRYSPIVTERADKLSAGESMQQVGDSRYTMAHLDGERIAVDTQAVAFTRVRPGESLLREAAE